MPESLIELLVRLHQLLPIQVQQYEQTARTLDVPVVSLLLERGVVHEDALLHVLQTHLLLELYDPEVQPSLEALRLLSQHEAERMLALPVRSSYQELVVAMVDPLEHRNFEELTFLTGREIHPLIGRYGDITRGIEEGYRRIATRVMPAQEQKPAGTAFSGELDTQELGTEPEHRELKSVAMRLEALIQLLENKGVIERGELIGCLRDLDLGADDD